MLPIGKEVDNCSINLSDLMKTLSKDTAAGSSPKRVVSPKTISRFRGKEEFRVNECTTFQCSPSGLIESTN